MKTLVNKNNPAIRITAPEITTDAAPNNNYLYVYWIPAINEMYNPIDWTLVEEEPEVDLEKELVNWVKKYAPRLLELVKKEVIEKRKEE